MYHNCALSSKGAPDSPTFRNTSLSLLNHLVAESMEDDYQICGVSILVVFLYSSFTDERRLFRSALAHLPAFVYMRPCCDGCKQLIYTMCFFDPGGDHEGTIQISSVASALHYVGMAGELGQEGGSWSKLRGCFWLCAYEKACLYIEIGNKGEVRDVSSATEDMSMREQV